MTKTGLLILMIFALPAKAIESDKIAHASVSYALFTGLYGLSKTTSPKRTRASRIRHVIPAAAVALAIGVVKELMDRNACEQRHRVECSIESGDLLANGVGVGMGIAAVFAFEF